MSRQLTFDLPLQVSLGQEDYFVSDSNAAVWGALERWETWPKGKFLILGPEGSGKSHLAQIWAARVGAHVVRPGDLTEAMLTDDSAAAWAIEDLHLAQTARHETLLFHLHNAAEAASKPLLMTGRGRARDWDFHLNDWQSRVLGTAAVLLEPPDDGLLQAVLLKQFADRQIAAPPTLVHWLIPRMERSFGAVTRMVAALDARSMAEGKPVSRKMAAALLEEAGDPA